LACCCMPSAVLLTANSVEFSGVSVLGSCGVGTVRSRLTCGASLGEVEGVWSGDVIGDTSVGPIEGASMRNAFCLTFCRCKEDSKNSRLVGLVFLGDTMPKRFGEKDIAFVTTDSAPLLATLDTLVVDLRRRRRMSSITMTPSLQ